MKTPARISVIVPVFNGEKYLKTLLESLFHQSETALEIIAIDDGSTDGTLSLLHEMARREPRLTVLQQAKNGGIASARNRALRLARGRWISFVDGDDWLHPATLRTWCEQAEKQNLDFLVGNAFHFSAATEASSTRSDASPLQMLSRQPWQEIVDGAAWITRSVSAAEWPHYAWLQMTRRDFLVENNAVFDEGMEHEDILWTMRLALRARRIGFCQRPLYGYRAHGASVVGNVAASNVQKRAASYLFIISQLDLAADDKRRSLGLRRALRRHANRESWHLLSLMRRKNNVGAKRREMAQEFFRLGLGRVLFRGANDRLSYWLAVRCCLAMRKWATQS